MKLALMPREPTWWIWLITATLLATGLGGHPATFIAAIGLSIMQMTFFWHRHRSPIATSVQIRLAYTALLLLCLLPPLRWLYWLPTIGTFALLIFGYCLTARTISLLPWNRHEPLSASLLCRTFFTAPRGASIGRQMQTCGTDEGVCELEARIAETTRHDSSTSLLPQPNSNL